MDVIALLILAVVVGWLATLIMHTDIADVSLLDFTIGVTGAGLVGGWLAPALGILTTGDEGFTLRGAFVSWVGAMSLLAVVNLARRGDVRCGSPTRRQSVADTAENSVTGRSAR